ncbi:ribonuclease J [Enemella sp. A6]|uniref:ribonuclease J n=1 Tax=Enemella sp. A6 TaxID=3440152 RepID=UPI003EB7178D
MVTIGLKTPPPLSPGTLRIIPLGGLGDVGRNMTSFEIDERLLLVDCGVLFPEEAHPGVDLILPSLDLVTSRVDEIEALILTHGHEDHIGAVPYLLRHRADIPIYGTELTLALVAEKLREHRIKGYDLRVVRAGDLVTAGPFDLEFVAVNHSIPDAIALAIGTKAGIVLHTGDFKMDQLPLDGRITDLRTFARLGEQGVDLFMVDSTNAEVPGFTTGEREIQPALDRVFAQAEGLVVVACFASHVHRVQQVLDTAVRSGRKVAYVGRSMLRNMKVAADLGYLQVPPGVLINLNDLDNHPAHEVVIISTGSQGEPLSALSRMANRQHQVVHLTERDTVVLASSLIPGNETSVFRVINGLITLGAKVVHQGNALVHVSGHASAGELLYCYNIVQPRNVMPIHGEYRHLIANRDLAVATGVPADNAIVTTDGGVVDLRDGKAELVGKLDAGYIFVDGTSVGAVSEALLTDRRILGEEGFVSVIAVVSTQSRELISGPDIHARGFGVDESVFDQIRDEIAQALLDALAEGVDDPHRLQQVMRRRVGRWVGNTFRRRPMIVPVVIIA